MVFGFERDGVRRGPSSAQPSRMFGIGSGCACGQWLEERSAAALVSNAYVMAAHGEPLGTSITTRPFRFEISVTLWVMTAGLISSTTALGPVTRTRRNQSAELLVILSRQSGPNSDARSCSNDFK